MKGFMMNQILEEISKVKIVPVVVIEDVENAYELGKALCDGGLPCAEVTFRTDAAEESIRILAKNFPDMIVGAGTVLSVEQVKRAVAAGAKFIVSPGFNPKVVQYCLDNNVPITPGIATPTEIEMALGLGVDVVKFFPAEAVGGLKALKAMSAPYTTVRFMPTGGINVNNVNSYLNFPKIIACGGSWMVKREMIKNKEFDQIKQLVAEAVSLVHNKEEE